ncbi:MAG: alpha-ketoglutarate-dependent dioxygenase AlkB [Sphingobacteriales bacterium JAD_PAG50586_3]|nr:MAG: alpha-ketoglutarate-dependent dioxygenase AlkB [Sphingobacteriales bacterium JAD_PAG50586_3]
MESPETEIAKISGLQYVENYLTRQEHDEILNAIDAAQWINDIKRRVQHYGFKYDYKARRIDYSMKIGDLPEWAQKVAVRLYRDGYFDVIPDQVIVNEYMPRSRYNTSY